VIHYAIDLAQRSGIFDIIQVSTDSREISRVAHEAGAMVHHRSQRTSDDKANDYAVIVEVLKTARPDYLCYLYPVTPLLDVEDLEKGYRMILSGLWPVVWAVGPGGKEAGAFYWMNRRDPVTEDEYYRNYGPVELGEFHYHDVNTEDDWRAMAAKYAAKYTQWG
jgi:hypothetical protein